MAICFNRHRLAQIKMKMKDLAEEIKIAKARREYMTAKELEYEYNRLQAAVENRKL